MNIYRGIITLILLMLIQCVPQSKVATMWVGRNKQVLLKSEGEPACSDMSSYPWRYYYFIPGRRAVIFTLDSSDIIIGGEVMRIKNLK